MLASVVVPRLFPLCILMNIKAYLLFKLLKYSVTIVLKGESLQFVKDCDHQPLEISCDHYILMLQFPISHFM